MEPLSPQPAFTRGRKEATPAWTIMTIAFVALTYFSVNFYRQFRDSYKDQSGYYLMLPVLGSAQDSLVDKPNNVYSGKEGKLKYGPVSALEAFIFYKTDNMVNASSLLYNYIMFFALAFLLSRLPKDNPFNQKAYRAIIAVCVVNYACGVSLSMREQWFEPIIYRMTHGAYMYWHSNSGTYLIAFSIFLNLAAWLYSRGIQLQREQELTV